MGVLRIRRARLGDAPACDYCDGRGTLACARYEQCDNCAGHRFVYQGEWVETRWPCPRCGSAQRPDCPACAGAPMQVVAQRILRAWPCPRCAGSGRLPCRRCLGAGAVACWCTAAWPAGA